MSETTVSKKGFLQAAKVHIEPKVLAILFLGFCSGLPAMLLASTLNYWVTDLGLSKTDIGILLSAGSPYALKFLWSPVVDKVQIPFLSRMLGQRRSWLVLTQILLVPSIYLLSLTSPLENYSVTYFVAVGIAILGATQDIAIDGVRIEYLENREQGPGSANYIAGYRIAYLMCSMGALYLVEKFGLNWELVITVFGILMMMGVVTVALMNEPEYEVTEEREKLEREVQSFIDKRSNMNETLAKMSAWTYMTVVAPFREFMLRKGWWVFLLFAVFYKLGDSMASSLSYAFYRDVGFTRIEIADMGKLVGFFAVMTGLAVGGTLMVRLGLWRALLVCAILQMLSNFMFSALNEVGNEIWFLALTVGFENFATGMGAAALVAYQSVLCNQSFAVTQYALLSALNQFTVRILSSPSGAIIEETGWFWFFILTVVIAVPGIILLYWIRKIDREDDKHSDLFND